MVDDRLLTILQGDFDDVETPWQVAGSEALEPGIGTAFDEFLFVAVHCVQAADSAARTAGFHFYEQQQLAVSGDDINLATVWTAEISREDAASLAAEKIPSDVFAAIADPSPVARLAIRPGQTAACIEQPAETSDDGGDKGRESEALQGASWCHILDASQSRIGGTPDPARA